MENEKVVSQYFHEGTVAVMERTIRRLWITTILLIVLLVGTNVAWMIYENSFEDIVVTQETELGGNNNYVGNDGNITNN